MDMPQVHSTIEASNQIGMISLQQYAKKLIEREIITPEEVEWLFYAPI